MAKIFEAPEEFKKSELLNDIDDALKDLVSGLTQDDFLVAGDYHFAIAGQNDVYVWKHGTDGKPESDGVKNFCDFFGHIYNNKLGDVDLMDIADCLQLIRSVKKHGVKKQFEIETDTARGE